MMSDGAQIGVPRELMLAGWLGCALLGGAQSVGATASSVHGRAVETLSAKPVAGVSARVDPQDHGGRARRAATDGTGRFWVEELGVGTWSLGVAVRGYEPARRRIGADGPEAELEPRVRGRPLLRDEMVRACLISQEL